MDLKTGNHFIFFHLPEPGPGSALIHPARGILVCSMKTLIQILLLALLAGCASPYYPVYVNGEGDYYIAERVTAGPYYGSGFYPWWVSTYPPQIFTYYSPYYYPYHFSVWYPPGYYPYYGFYGGYYGYWYPPYRNQRHHRYPGEHRIVVTPALPPAIDSRQVVTNPGLPFNRDLVTRRGRGQRAAVPPRSASAYSRTPPQSSAPTQRMSPASPARFSQPSIHAGSTGRGKTSSSNLSARHRQ